MLDLVAAGGRRDDLVAGRCADGLHRGVVTRVGERDDEAWCPRSRRRSPGARGRRASGIVVAASGCSGYSVKSMKRRPTVSAIAALRSFSAPARCGAAPPGAGRRCGGTRPSRSRGRHGTARGDRSGTRRGLGPGSRASRASLPRIGGPGPD